MAFCPDLVFDFENMHSTAEQVETNPEENAKKKIKIKRRKKINNLTNFEIVTTTTFIENVE